MIKKYNYSKNFEETYSFYMKNINIFTFTGGKINKTDDIIHDINGYDAKYCFFIKESQGKNIPCSEIDLLYGLLTCKGGINFQIKQWAEGLVDGTLPLHELSKDFYYEKFPYANKEIIEASTTLEWVDKNPVYYRDIKTQYNLPIWVINACYNQAMKQLRSKLKNVILNKT